VRAGRGREKRRGLLHFFDLELDMAMPERSAVLIRRDASRAGGVREVLDLAFPVILTQLSQTTMGVVDTAMVGRLGATPLAGVGFGAVWMWTIFSLFYGAASGVQTFVAQEDGAGRAQRCGAWAWQGLYAVVPVAALTVALGAPLVRPVLGALGPSAELQEAAAAYIGALIWGEVGFAVVMVLTSFFRGLGDTRTPLYVTVAANVVNAALAYGLIFGHLGLPALGAQGAGAATAVASWFSALVLFAAFRRRALASVYHTQLVPPRLDEIRRFLRTGAPIGGQWFIGMTSFAVFTTLVARMSDASMAASQAFVMLLSLSFMQAIGLSIATSTLVGRFIGADDPESAQRSFRSSLWLGGLVGGAVALLFVAAPGPLLRIFTDDPGVVALGRPLLLLGALYQLFDQVAIIAQGALRGAGDTRWPFVVETALGWGFFVPSAYLLGIVLEGGLTGAWIGGLLYVSVLSAVLVGRFLSGAWQQIRI
jgi:MATE family multidrug resistance protein